MKSFMIAAVVALASVAANADVVFTIDLNDGAVSMFNDSSDLSVGSYELTLLDTAKGDFDPSKGFETPYPPFGTFGPLLGSPLANTDKLAEVSASATDLTLPSGLTVLGNAGTFTLAPGAELFASDFKALVDGSAANTSVNIIPVPEPASIALLGLGGVAMLLRRRSA